MYAPYVLHSTLNISCDLLENQTAAMEQPSKDQLCRADIKHVRLVNNPRGKSAFVANQQGLFQVPASVSTDSIGVANFFQARFLLVLARWLFTREPTVSNPAFINVLDLWRSRFPTYLDDTLVRSHRYESTESNRLDIAANAVNMLVLMRKRRTAALTKLEISQTFSGAAIHAAFDAFRAIPQAAWFCYPSAIAFEHICDIRYLSGSSKYCGRAQCHHSCSTSFALLFSEKYQFSSLRVWWLHLLSGSRPYCWMKQIWMLSVHLFHCSLGDRILLTPSLSSFPVRRNLCFKIEQSYL